MKAKIWVILTAILTVIIAVVFYSYLSSHNLAVLNPMGEIADKERRLIFITFLLSVAVVIPVFGLTIYIAWKYRDSNHKAKYSPHWDHDAKLEFAWWAVPIVIISILAVVTWQYTHSLDPFKPLQSSSKPVKVQVIALQWRWLFIYPEYNVASVNYMPIPINRPINMQITSDAPMNSIWIPQLSGQIYAMSGMSTKLHLNAHTIGEYRGVSANISGEGFAGMTFKVKASSQQDFNKWIVKAKRSNNYLSYEKYQLLAQPSKDRNVIIYSNVDNDLYDKVIMKYMKPGGDTKKSEMNHESM